MFILPDELLLLLSSFFSHQSLCRLSCVNSICFQWTNQPQIWQLFLERHFPVLDILFAETQLHLGSRPPPCISLEALSPKALFRHYATRNNVCVIDCGSGYCKYGFSRDGVPSGSTIFLEYGDTQHVVEDPACVEALQRMFALAFVRLGGQIQGMPFMVVEPLHYVSSNTEDTAKRHVSRDLVASLLFKLTDTPRICFVSQALCALYSIRRTTGIIVNLGFNKTSIVPVVDGKILRNFVISNRLGAGTISLILSRFIAAREHQWNMSDVRKIKENLCFIRLDPNDQEVPPPVPFSFETDNGPMVVHLQEELYVSPEVLFVPERFGIAESGLGEILRTCLRGLATAVPDRFDLLSTIVLCGGTSKLTGLVARVKHELNGVLTPVKHPTLGTTFDIPMNILVPPMAESPWHGANMIASMRNFESDWTISRAQYGQFGPLFLNMMFE